MKTKVNMFELNSNDITDKLINECELLREQIYKYIDQTS
jgi:hypothetical protein